jgi:fimbrial isopeptide formation D2 family protein/uncharacterized repeat protein (TIGR01451 family)
MFEKILSVLPYNPGLLHQMSFYSRRMREEAAIRRTGMVFIVLAFMIQFFAVLSPPQTSAAASSNDLVNGGFSSASDAANYCNQNVAHYGDILQNYGITCKEVANSPTVPSLGSTDDNRDLYSMGRLPYNIAGETPVNVQGITYYFRYLWGWDTGAPSHYKALRIIASTGKTYYLLYGCGNLVSIGLPQPYTPPAPAPTATLTATTPILVLKKTMLAGYPADGSTVAPGTALGYQIEIDNTGGAAHSVDLTDALPANLTYQSISLNAGADTHIYNANTRTAEWSWGTIGNEVGNYNVTLKATVNTNTPNGTKICNIAHLSATGDSGLTSGQVCVTVEQNTPPPPTAPPVAPPTTVTPTCANGGLAPSSPQCFQPCQYNATISATDTACTPCQYNNAIAASDSQCKPCEASLSSQDTLACVSVSKTASNITAGIANADGTTANAGDTIVYTLHAQNNGKAAVAGFTFQENIADVLAYADVVDLHGGTMDANDQITWPTQAIPAGATATEQVTVQVKNPVPSTPVDPADPGHFDLTMTNVYGNTVNIKVAPPVAKSIETAAAQLPNTGPGTSIFIAAAIIVISGYFYGRARLLARESVLAIQENSGA